MKPLPDDYTIRLVDMPYSVGGCITECPDGHVDVYINARQSHAGRYRAADHEFDHWRRGDLHNGLDIREVEKRNKLPPLMRARDLLPPPPLPPRPAPPRLNKHQIRTLIRCLNELDRPLFSESYEF